MGLINLLTDPKNFKFYNGGQGYTGDGTKSSLLDIPYGKDRIDGGSSNQPYITSPILYNQNNVTLLRNDFLLRGGTTYPENAAQDVVRLFKMFTDTKSPNGLLFIAKQQLLSRTAVRTEASKSPLNEGIYNPVNTLLEAGGVGFGLHLKKQSFTSNYFNVATKNNKPYNLQYKQVNETTYNNDLPFAGSNPSFENTYDSGGLLNTVTTNVKVRGQSNRLLNLWDNFIDSKNANPVLQSYSGGPGSFLGAGKTNIKITTQRTGENNSLAINDPTYFYTGSLKSVSIDDLGSKIQQGGLLIKTSQNWTTINEYKIFDPLSSKYSNYYSGLPNFNVNSSQSSGLGSIQKSPIGFSGSISVHSNNKQEGGLKINTNQKWTSTGEYNVYNINSLGRGKATSSSISLGLPSFDVNTSQILGTSLQVNNTKKPQTRAGTASLSYNPTNAAGTVSNKYDKSFGAFLNRFELFPSSSWDITSGEKLWINNVYKPNLFSENTSLINAQGTYTYTQLDLVKTTPITPGKLSFSPEIQDFRKILRENISSSQYPSSSKAEKSGQLTAAPDYKNQNLEKRVSIGYKDGSGPGARSNKNYSNYTEGVRYIDTDKNVGALDRLNATKPYYETTAKSGAPYDDLVDFRIAIIYNDNPENKDFIHFRAFLDTISDAYTANWDPVKYLGRGENFYNYGGYTRQISLGWTVAAQSKPELIPMYKKLNFLASSLTPLYSTYGYMTGNMAQLTIGGYVYEQPGIITGLTYTLETDTTWEIGINTSGNKDSNVKQLPHIIKVTGFNFIPIQRFRPEIQNTWNDWKQYISLADGDGEKGNSYGSIPPAPTVTIETDDV